MEKTNFDNLIERYVKGQLNEKEKIKLEAWLDVVKTKYKAQLTLTKRDEDRLFNKITSIIEGVEEVISFQPESFGRDSIPRKSLFTQPWFKVAAMIVLLLAASYTIWQVTSGKEPLTEIIAGAAVEKHILDDETIVWLQPGSKLSYFENMDKRAREASLEGEALFEVAKDPDRPFVISCGDIVVKVLGTSFNLKTNKETVELKVLTGKVNLSSPSDQTGITVMPNQSVAYTTLGTVERAAMTDLEVNEIIHDTEYNMAFNDVTMDRVIERIEKKFNVRIDVRNKQVYKCHISADFSDNSLTGTLQMLAGIIDVDYEVNKGVVTLSGNGCE